MDNLNKKQKRMLWNMCNAAQNQGVKFLFQYEGSLVMNQKPSKEVTQWYNETKEEFKELQAIKDLLFK